MPCGEVPVLLNFRCLQNQQTQRCHVVKFQFWISSSVESANPEMPCDEVPVLLHLQFVRNGNFSYVMSEEVGHSWTLLINKAESSLIDVEYCKVESFLAFLWLHPAMNLDLKTGVPLSKSPES